MVRRLAAWLLIALTVLPFTAPFATYDQGTLFGEIATVSVEGSPSTPSVDDGVLSRTYSSFEMLIRSRFAALTETQRPAPRPVLTRALPPVTALRADSSSLSASLLALRI